MFSNVIKEAQEYTRSAIFLFKFAELEAESIIGTFIHVDDLGHILSARHMFTVGSEDRLDAFSVIFDRRFTQAEIVAEDIPNDLILLRLKDYKSGLIRSFPQFFRSSEKTLPKGISLVRLGYPLDKEYSNVPFKWDQTKKAFNWDGHGTRLTCFANSGTFLQYEIDPEKDVHLLELKTPALIGQSGGPLLTTQGIVVGLQSKNSVYCLPSGHILETGKAASHLSIARLLEKYPYVRTSWA